MGNEGPDQSECHSHSRNRLTEWIDTYRIQWQRKGITQFARLGRLAWVFFIGSRCKYIFPLYKWDPLWNYENTLIQIYWKYSYQKLKVFRKKNLIFLHISTQNIHCGYSLEPPRRGGSSEYPQSMFLSRNKKNDVYPCKPQFYCIQVGFKGVKTI